MPIGKNAIKRVTNNGYSNVKTAAPDMENSVEVKEAPALVAEEKVSAKKTSAKTPSKAAETKKAADTKVSAEKKTTGTKAPKKSMEAEPELSPVKTVEKVVKKTSKAQKRQGDGYVNLGGELPYYLL
ncbi:MAG: hypothetical protein J6B45_02920 [Clostridia bacterium]|nr:hypothetical protein [Clostridia bacterium]